MDIFIHSLINFRQHLILVDKWGIKQIKETKVINSFINTLGMKYRVKSFWFLALKNLRALLGNG